MSEELERLRQAALAMADGIFDVDLPVGTGDTQIDRLNAAIVGLGRSLNERFRRLRNLAIATQQANEGVLLDEVLEQVFEAFRIVIPYDRIGCALLEKDGTEVVARAHWAQAEYQEIQIGVGYSAPLAGSSLQRILASGQPRILNDLEQYLKEHPDSNSTRLILREGVRSSLTCPLIAVDRPVGFIFFSSRQPNTYRDAHVATYQDIAAHLSIIIEKSRLYHDLIELNIQKNRFVGIVAHDLRHPISVIKGYSQMLAKHVLGPVSPQQEEVLEIMNQSCMMMLALIDDLLDVGAIEAGEVQVKRQSTEIAGFLETCFSALRLSAEAKGIRLELELSDGPQMVDIDIVRMNQVVANLVTNAIKFSESGTLVRIGSRVENEHVEIYVADQGPGIPEDEHQAIFTEFGRASTRPTAGETSTGLGLAIVKRLVEAHGGTVEVSSVLGEGTTFRVILPTSSPTA